MSVRTPRHVTEKLIPSFKRFSHDTAAAQTSDRRVSCACATDETLCEVRRCLREASAKQESVRAAAALRTDLEGMLQSLKAVMERTISRHNATVAALAENFRGMLNEHRTIVDECERLETSAERQAAKTFGLCGVYEKERSQQRTLEAKNVRLAAENQQLREQLGHDDTRDRLRAERDALAERRKRTTVDLDEATAALAECRAELEADRHEFCELTGAVRDAEGEARRRMLQEMKLTEFERSLTHAINVGSKREKAVNAMLAGQKAWHERLKSSVDTAQRKVVALRDKERPANADGPIGKLHESVTRVEVELVGLRQRNDQQEAELAGLRQQNVRLMDRADELRRKLADVETATAEATVIQTYQDRLDEVARARDELASKCQRIVELKDLCERAERERAERERVERECAEREKLEVEAVATTKQTSLCDRKRRYHVDADRSSYHPVYRSDEILTELMAENLWQPAENVGPSVVNTLEDTEQKNFEKLLAECQAMIDMN